MGNLFFTSRDIINTLLDFGYKCEKKSLTGDWEKYTGPSKEIILVNITNNTWLNVMPNSLNKDVGGHAVGLVMKLINSGPREALSYLNKLRNKKNKK